MFGKNKKRIAALESRTKELESSVSYLSTITTAEYGKIPTKSVWIYMTRLLDKRIKDVREGGKTHE